MEDTSKAVLKCLFLSRTGYIGAQPGIFQGREVSWNRGTSIKVSCTTYEKRAPQEKVVVFFLQDTLKIAI